MSEFSRFIQYWQVPGVRDRINEARRQRYKEDADARETKKAAARCRYVKKLEPAARKRGPNRPESIQINGQDIVLLSLGDAAQRCGVSKEAFRRYDDQGVIPRNRRIDDQRRRWYPEAFIAFLAPFFAEQRVKKAPLWSLKRRVEAQWAGVTDIPVLSEERHGEADRSQ